MKPINPAFEESKQLRRLSERGFLMFALVDMIAPRLLRWFWPDLADISVEAKWMEADRRERELG